MSALLYEKPEIQDMHKYYTVYEYSIGLVYMEPRQPACRDELSYSSWRKHSVRVTMLQTFSSRQASWCLYMTERASPSSRMNHREPTRYLWSFWIRYVYFFCISTCLQLSTQAAQAYSLYFALVGSQLFARGVNLNWPIRAQSGTCSSRFQTAVDVEHGSRMFVLPYGRILFKLSTTKNGFVFTLEVLYEGKFTWLYWNMIFMVIRCSPS